MPIEPATDTKMVRAFLVIKFLSDKDNAVKKDIFVFLLLLPALKASRSVLILPSYFLESAVILPSFKRIILVAYWSASSGLCVTIITSLSLAISFRSSIIWILVSESRAPVGSSASKISGSFTSARAIATRCICPPESWLGSLSICSDRPTSFRAFLARIIESLFEIPESVSARRTFCKTVWCGIKL